MGTETQTTRIERLRSKPWNARGFRVPDEVFEVPGMLSHQEKRLLYYLARHDYAGEGAIADMGTFLGGSAICFAAGLRERSFGGRVIHSYDLFKVGGTELRKYFGDNPPPDFRTRHVFEEHLRDHMDLITVHEGDLLEKPWDGGPIEILFVDIAKSYKTFDHLLESYFPALIPSRSLIVMQDYLWGSTGPWHHVVLEKLSDYCEYVVDTDYSSVVFALSGEIPASLLEECRWEAISRDEKLRLMDQAIDKLDTEEKKDYLRQNREILASGKDMSWGMRYHRF